MKVVSDLINTRYDQKSGQRMIIVKCSYFDSTKDKKFEVDPKNLAKYISGKKI